MIVSPTTSDHSQIDALLEAAFGGRDEVALVRGLRASGAMRHELVEKRDGLVIGHLAFSPLSGLRDSLALAPLCVLPDWQRQGIGRGLVKHGLELSARNGVKSMFVLGDPDYYAGLGFSVELARSFQSPYSGPHFMALELTEGSLAGQSGPLQHADIFSGIEGDS